MNREEFSNMTKSGIVFLDGATGMNLVKKGMPTGVCPEKWILDNPQVIVELKRSYVEAGSNIIDAATFAANRIKLAEYGLEGEIEHINRELVKLAKVAADGKALVAANLTMTGEQLFPIGKMKFEELVDVYKEQISYILMEGVDLFVVETMMSLQECRAAVLAIKETCDLPVLVYLTFNEDGRTLYGTNPETAMIVLQSMGVDAVGVNCSTGPDKMEIIVSEMAKVASIPIVAKPNAGLPRLENGNTVYDTNPEEFAEGVRRLVKAGASIVGGCCGTTPKHIAAMVNLIKKCYKEKNFLNPFVERLEKGQNTNVRALTTERKTTYIDLDGPFMVVGERINPTGKKNLQEELRNDTYDIVVSMAEEQVQLGADILDINVGMSGISEQEVMLKVMNEVMNVTDVPLAIDSSYVDVVEAALRVYPGRALINSISLEKEKFEKLLPIAKKYGAMFILLPLSDKGLPEGIDEKKEIIKTILDRAYSLGLTKEDIIVDGLVTTVGANKNAALEVLETINYCKNELGLATICGLSNISFGLPERQFVNSTFLAFAIKEGLTMAIANPSQNLLMNTAYASELLKAKAEADIKYINRVNEYPMSVGVTETKVQKKDKANIDGRSDIFVKVAKGNKRNIIESVNEALEEGISASDILNNELIPAINYVGELFEKKIYFLPQLISSAEAMKIAIDYLEPMLASNDNSKKETIVIATVEGDIHDIGKNLVALMLKNYGYNVIDLGKDVNAEEIIDTAIKNNAKIIALSALMTTTMMQMKTVVDMVKDRGIDIKIIVGGAVVTKEFCDEIKADGYSKDAQEAISVVKSLLTP